MSWSGAPLQCGSSRRTFGVVFPVTGLTSHPLPPNIAHPGCCCSLLGLNPPRGPEALHLPVYSVFISLESVVNGGAHTGRHGVGVGGVRVLVRVQLGPVVEVHRLHGPGAVRVSVHGGRDAHPVHRVVGQVFVLHTTTKHEGSHSGYTQMHRKNIKDSGAVTWLQMHKSEKYYKSCGRIQERVSPFFSKNCQLSENSSINFQHFLH